MTRMTAEVTISRSVLSIVFAALLAGCASKGVQQVESVAVVDGGQSEQPEQLPSTPFAAETLYDLLAAEIGGQRQRYDVALGNYLKQAHQTRDAGVAQRAYQIAVYVGARQAALDAALLWLELQPESPDALRSSTLELVYAGRLERAFIQMERQLQAGERPAFDMLASSVGRQQAQDFARRFAELAKQYPEVRELTLGQAILMHQAGDYASALALADGLLGQDRDFIPAVMVKGRALDKQGRYAEAAELLSEAVRSHPDQHRLRLLFGRVLLHAGQLDEARQQFEYLVRQEPDDSGILLSLALITMENNLAQEAQQYFQRLLALGEREDTAHYYLGRLHEQQQQYQLAKDHYRSVGPGKQFMAAQVALARMMAGQKQLDEALVIVKEAREQNPAWQEPLFLLEAELLINADQPEKALQVYEQALKGLPESINLLYGRAMAYEKLDDLEGLERDLRAILALDAQNTAALNALGFTLADRTLRYEEAQTLIMQAYKLNSDDPAILDSMGWVQFRMGNFEQAEKYLQMAYARLPDDEIAAHLGEVLWMKGERAAARSLWAEALQVSPDSQILQETMDRLVGESKK